MLGISFDDTAAIAAAAAAAAADPNAEVAPPKRLLYTHLTKEKVCVSIGAPKEVLANPACPSCPPLIDATLWEVVQHHRRQRPR